MYVFLIIPNGANFPLASFGPFDTGIEADEAMEEVYYEFQNEFGNPRFDWKEIHRIKVHSDADSLKRQVEFKLMSAKQRARAMKLPR